MKKFIGFALILTLIASSFTGCWFDKDPTEEEIQMTEKLTAIYEDLVKNIPDTSDAKAQRDYLFKWATDRDIPVSHDKQGNLIMSKKATEGYEDALATTFQFTIGSGADIQQYEGMATILYIMENVENHGFIRGLFTEVNDNKFTGSQSLSTNYLKGDRLINLTHGEKTLFTIGSAGKMDYEVYKPLQWSTPSYPKAYEISIKGLKSEDAGVVSGLHPNPIKTIGDFLASAKSKGLLIELASFNGGDYADTYPSQATAVVLINENDEEKFQNWFDNEKEKFDDKYEDLNTDDIPDNDYTFTLTPVQSPETVISKEDSSQVFGLIYTMINGTYMKTDEKELIALSNIGYISTQSGDLELGITGKSLNDEILSEMNSTFKVICGLNDATIEITDTFPTWTANEESPLLLYLTDKFKTDFDKKVKSTSVLTTSECAVFKNKKDALDVISMSVNFENGVHEIEVLCSMLADNSTNM